MAKEQTPATGDLYSRLGINRGATDEQVQDAYYRLAKAFHPDKLKSGEVDEEAFNSIVQAAAILRDPARRKLYDRGAIDRDGMTVRSSGLWSRWSYREVALACLTAMTVLVSYAVFYSRDKSGTALPAAEVQAAGKEESPAAGAAGAPEAQVQEPALAPYSHDSPAELLKALLKRPAGGGGSPEASHAHPAAQGEEPASAPHIDDNPAELLKVLLRQQPVYSPSPSTTPIDRTETAPAANAAAPENGRGQAALISATYFKNLAAPQQESKLSPSSSAIIRHPRANSRLPGECALTPAARAILASIISH